MGKFLLAQLKARPSGLHFLTDDAIDAMHAQHFAPSSELPGVAYGFFEARDAGGRGLFHASGRDHFSLLYLVPERSFGIYIVMCGASEASQLPSKVVHAFLEHLFGSSNPPKQVASFAAIPGWLPGRYASMQSAMRLSKNWLALGRRCEYEPLATISMLRFPVFRVADPPNDTCKLLRCCFDPRRGPY
jgi:hypothetical protein